MSAAFRSSVSINEGSMNNNNESQQLKSLGWGLHAAGASVAVALLLGIHGLVLSALRAENTRLEQQITVHSDYNDTASMISSEISTAS